jgi:hypothetical protein
VVVSRLNHGRSGILRPVARRVQTCSGARCIEAMARTAFTLPELAGGDDIPVNPQPYVTVPLNTRMEINVQVEAFAKRHDPEKTSLRRMVQQRSGQER